MPVLKIPWKPLQPEGEKLSTMQEVQQWLSDSLSTPLWSEAVTSRVESLNFWRTKSFLSTMAPLNYVEPASRNRFTASCHAATVLRAEIDQN